MISKEVIQVLLLYFSVKVFKFVSDFLEVLSLFKKYEVDYTKTVVLFSSYVSYWGKVPLSIVVHLCSLFNNSCYFELQSSWAMNYQIHYGEVLSSRVLHLKWNQRTALSCALTKRTIACLLICFWFLRQSHHAYAHGPLNPTLIRDYTQQNSDGQKFVE